MLKMDSIVIEIQQLAIRMIKIDTIIGMEQMAIIIMGTQQIETIMGIQQMDTIFRIRQMVEWMIEMDPIQVIVIDAMMKNHHVVVQVMAVFWTVFWVVYRNYFKMILIFCV